MSSNLLSILQQLTKPKSPEEVRKFLIERHGTTVRDNASSDVTALDEVATKIFNAGSKVTKNSIYSAILEGKTVRGKAKGYRDKVKAIRGKHRRASEERVFMAVETLRNKRKIKA